MHAVLRVDAVSVDAADVPYLQKSLTIRVIIFRFRLIIFWIMPQRVSRSVLPCNTRIPQNCHYIAVVIGASSCRSKSEYI